MTANELTYRRDIDGLRAVAVILVILFHAHLGFSGGFVGVDVFFVISGYLITAIICKQQANDRFSFFRFWARRICRLAPAATCMTLAAVAAGYFLLLPLDYTALAKSAACQPAMMGNVYFWRHSGYFSGSSDMMPLLHTWSLAIEEQFYLCYPFLLMCLARRSAACRTYSLGIIAVVSFLVSVWSVGRYPGASFYLLPFRAWELLLGGLVASMQPIWCNPRPLLANAMSLVGLVGILLPATTYTAATPFPGIAAAAPCCGTALVIWAGTTGASVINRLLGCLPLAFIGLMSYSLYLWHWPIFVFARHALGPDLALPTRAIALCATFAIAYVSWRCVEKPLRASGNDDSLRMNLYAACLPIPVLLATCGLILGRDGFPSRAPALALHYHSARNDKLHQHSVSLETLARNEIPVFGDPAGDRTCLIWGDSHAMALVAGLDAACKKHHIRGVQATYAGTAPVRGFHITTGLGLREKAVPHADAVLEYARRNNIDYVVLAAYWTRYAHNPDLERCLSDTVRTLAQQGSQVAIVLDYAKQSEDVPLMLARRAFRGAPTSDCGTPMQRHLDVNASVNRAIGHAAGGIALVLDPAPFLTDGSGLWRSEMDGIALYYDDDHLSTPGALRLAPMFDSMLETMQSRTRATND